MRNPIRCEHIGLALLAVLFPGCAGDPHASESEVTASPVADARADQGQGDSQARPGHDHARGGHEPEHSRSAHDHGRARSHGLPADRYGAPSGATTDRPVAKLGELVDDFEVLDSAGQAFRLASFGSNAKHDGRIVVLTFWCTTCHSCRHVEKEFDAKAKAYEGQGAAFVMVDSNHPDTADRVNEFRSAKGLGFRVLMDANSRLARSFGASRTTTTAVIDRAGRLRYFGDVRGAEAAVQDLLAGNEVAVASKPGGG